MGSFWSFFSEPGIMMSFYIVIKVRNNLCPSGFSKIRPKSFFLWLVIWAIFINFTRFSKKCIFQKKFIIFELLSFNQVVYSILNIFKFNSYRSCLKCILWGGEEGGQREAKSSPYEKYPLVKLKLPKQVKRFGAHCLILLLLHWSSTVMLLPCSSKAAALQHQCCCNSQNQKISKKSIFYTFFYVFSRK